MMRHSVKWLVLGLLSCAGAAHALSSQERLEQGQQAYLSGDNSLAAEHWQAALQAEDLTLYQQIDVLLRLAVVQQTQGAYQQAYQTLEQVQPLVEADGSSAQKKLFYSYLGDLMLALQRPFEAKRWLEKGVAETAKSSQPQIDAHLFNNLGNTLSVLSDPGSALAMYQEAGQMAELSGDQLLYLQVLSNQVRLLIVRGEFAEAYVKISQAADLASRLSSLSAQGFYLLSLGEMAFELYQKYPQASALDLSATLLAQAEQIARQQEDQYLLAQTLMQQAWIRHHQAKHAEALDNLREVSFFSQQSPEILYRAEWLRGQIYLAQGRLADSENSFQHAIELLYPIQLGLSNGQRNALSIFHKRVRPVYFGLADVLLKQATTVQGERKQTLLRQARNTLEQLRTAELQDYFRDECLDTNHTTELETLDPHTAVLYPVILADRLSLLLGIQGQLQEISIPVSEDLFTQTVLEFQENLQVRNRWSLLRQARQLYQWLVEPFEEQLQAANIDTLVIVPDGVLRMIPLSALHTGKNFLIDKYALVTTPSLNLTNPRALPRQDIQIMLNGLSEGVQGFSPLPNVPAELKGIQAIFPKNKVLLDQDFSLPRLDNSLLAQPYQIVHIASHGQFDRDPKQTFVLTYDGKMDMAHLKDTLGRYREHPVELLTLSACQTAVGDERAALGLAGVAIKAGARSALASLWFVNDEATAKLITLFYENLKNPEYSKAKALQQAQKALLEERRFRHPAYWSPFLLIGNWL